MWVYCDSCMAYKGARVVIDHAARRTSCAECGHEIEDGVADPIVRVAGEDVAENETVRGSDPINSEPKNDSSVDFLSRVVGYSQNPASDSVSVATSQPQSGSSDDFLSLTLGNSQTLRGKDTVALRGQDTVFATLSHRLGLPATVENEANEIFKKLEHSSMENAIPIGGFYAACIFIACRSIKDQTRSLSEISSVVYKVTVPEIRNAVEFIADRMGFSKDKLLKIKAVDFMKRFCSKLGMNSKEVHAAEEAVRNYDVLESSQKGPESVAAAVLYVIDQLSYENKLFKDIIDVTGVAESMLKAAYKDIYPLLAVIIPIWFANAIDMMNLASP